MPSVLWLAWRWQIHQRVSQALVAAAEGPMHAIWELAGKEWDAMPCLGEQGACCSRSNSMH